MEESIVSSSGVKQIEEQMYSLEVEIQELVKESEKQRQDRENQLYQTVLEQSMEEVQEKQVVPFEKLLRIQKLLKQHEKIINLSFAEKYKKIAFKYINYLIKTIQVCELQLETMNQKDQNYKPTHQTLEKIKNIIFHQLDNTDFFPFQTFFQQFLFQKLLNKISYKKQLGNYQDCMQNALDCFSDQTQEQMVNDKCVGCNEFFYRFHLIQTLINSKDVQVKFLYNYNAKEAQLCEEKVVLYPPKTQVIEIGNIREYEDNFLNCVVELLKSQGGYIMIGCKSLDCLVNNQILNEVDQYFFNGVNFVVGQTIRETQKEVFIKDIASIIQKISPQIKMDKHIKVRFLPVIPSKFNQGFSLKQIYKNTGQDLQIILIGVNPSASEYQISEKQTELVQLEDQQEEDCFLNSSFKGIFDRHICKYKGKKVNK